MKKRIAIFLMLLFVINIDFCYADGTISPENISILQGGNSYKFVVSVKSMAGSQRPTILVFDQGKTRVLYAGIGTCRSGGDGFIFDYAEFKLPNNSVSGNYLIRVGGEGVTAAEKLFSFVNKLDIINALAAINGAARDKIKDTLNQHAGALGLDITDYLLLDSIWQERVDEVIYNLDVSVNAEKTDYEEKKQLLINALEQNIEAVSICGGKTASEIVLSIDNSTKLNLDKETYYKALENKTAIGTILLTYNFIKMTGIDINIINKQFDGAVLLSAIKQLDWETIRNALLYYESKNLLAMNYDTYNKLNSVNKTAAYNQMKEENMSDYTQIPSTFKKICDYLYATQIEDSNNNKNRGGNSGSGKSSSSYTVATTTPAPKPTAPVVTEPENSETFSDLENVPWAKIAIDSLAEKDIVAGKEKGIFCPNDYISREEFIKMITLAFSLYRSDAAAVFDDVKKDDWYYTYIASAEKAGIISGMSDHEFGVGSCITRQDMAVILGRTYGLLGKTINIPQDNYYNDYEKVDNYAKKAVMKMKKLGILNGDENCNFKPLDNVTRAEGATAVYRLICLKEGK